MKKILIAVTGASGQIYAKRIIELIIESGNRVNVIFTETAQKVWLDELNNLPLPQKEILIDNNSYYHKYASGSNPADAMIVIPCTMGTAARIANGLSSDLICRVADVMLKERLPLVIVPRESPFNLIHLTNLTKLAQAGAIIAPASPSFYTKPESIEEMADQLCKRVLNIVGVDSQMKRFHSQL
jgi:4-hydroxy-3-polyprenylbenzoate decarboxylase